MDFIWQSSKTLRLKPEGLFSFGDNSSPSFNRPANPWSIAAKSRAFGPLVPETFGFAIVPYLNWLDFVMSVEPQPDGSSFCGPLPNGLDFAGRVEHQLDGSSFCGP